MREEFDIINDFTPEEEQKIRDENKWAEEPWYVFSDTRFQIHGSDLWFLSLSLNNVFFSMKKLFFRYFYTKISRSFENRAILKNRACSIIILF